MGRVSADYYVQDGVVPAHEPSGSPRRIRALEQRSGLQIGKCFTR